MKVTLRKVAGLSIKDLITKSTATINRTVRNFCGDCAGEEELDTLLTRIRQIRILIRNDADSTFRMIEMRPPMEDHYRELWAQCADKLIDECGISMLNIIRKEYDPSGDHGERFSPEEMDAWASEAPEQDKTPTPIEKGEG